MGRKTDRLRSIKLAMFVASILFLFVASVILAVPRFESAQNATGIYLVYGPATFVRATGKVQIETSSFGARQPGKDYLIRILNGGQAGQFDRVSSAQVAINQQFVAVPSEFNQQVQIIERRVSLEASNTLSVKIASAPGSGLTIEIYGFDHDAPVISAIAAPPANTAGWNNTNLTVSFTCLDALSGVASCPSPVTVATEGSQQTVTGTATDRAGNSATTSVTLNIDKTSPSLNLISPQDQTVVEANVTTLAGTLTDALSRLDQVTCNGVPAALYGLEFSCAVSLAEGFNSIDVRASDRAGNVASRNLMVTSVVPRPIGPDGGTIEAFGGRVRLVIPPGALAEVVPINIRPLSSSLGNLLPDTLFEFGPDGTRFLQPVELTLAYNPASVPQVQAASLRIAKLLPDGTLRLTPPGEVDTADHSVTAEIHGFSSYGVTTACSDPSSFCRTPPTLTTAQYMQNRTVNLSWSYPPLDQNIPLIVILERAVVRGGEPCDEGEPYCVCDGGGCRLNGLQPPHDADYRTLERISTSYTAHTDYEIAPDSAFYWYRIRWSGTTESYASEPRSVLVFGPQGPPSDPASLTATALTCGGVELEWPLVSEANNYLIQRAEPDGSFYSLALLPQHTVFYADTAPMTEGVVYTYRVISVINLLRSPGHTTATSKAPGSCEGSTHIEVSTYSEQEQRNAEWVGFREGLGEWRKVHGVGGSYGFDVTAVAAGRYSVAVVCPGSSTGFGAGQTTHVLELTTDDPRSLSLTCDRLEPRDQMVTLSVINKPPLTAEGGSISSYLFTRIGPGATPLITYVHPGIYDVVALALDYNNNLAISRIGVVRGVAVSGPVTVEADLGDAAVAEPHTFSASGATFIRTSVELLTAGGTSTSLVQFSDRMKYQGLPAAAQQSGDIHRLSVSSTSGSVYTYLKAPEDLYVDLASLPATLPRPTVAITRRSPRLGISADFRERAAALPDAVGYSIQYQHFNAATDSSRTWRVFLSGRWLAGQPQVYELPDFTSAPDWQSVWELPSTATTINWTFTAYTTNGDASTFVQSLYSPLNREGRVLPHGFVRREFSVSGTVH